MGRINSGCIWRSNLSSMISRTPLRKVTVPINATILFFWFKAVYVKLDPRIINEYPKISYPLI